MAAKRHTRRLRSDDSKESGRNGGNEDSDDDDEESGKFGEDNIPAEPKEMPLKLAEEHSPLSPEDAGPRVPARSAPSGGVALKTKTSNSKRVKKPPPASHEEDEAEDSGDALVAMGPLPDDSAHAGHNNKRAATPKRGEKRPPAPRQEEERPETVVASGPRRKKKSKRSAEKDKKKKQLKKASTKPDEEGEGIPQHGQPSDTSLPPEKNRVHDQEREETEAHVNGKASQVRNAPSNKPCSSVTEKKPAVERSWSYDDELKILNALVVLAKSHDGALPDSSHLLANLTFDKIDVNEEKLTDKIRKMRTRYRRFLSHGCPSDSLSRQLFKLSKILWGQVDEDEQVEPTSRDFGVLSELYPYLAKEVKAYAERHSSGDLIMAMFMTIGDETARNLDAKCKKQQIQAFKLELGQESLTNELLSTLSNLTRVKF